jgi:hypothetical protein
MIPLNMLEKIWYEVVEGGPDKATLPADDGDGGSVVMKASVAEQVGEEDPMVAAETSKEATAGAYTMMELSEDGDSSPTRATEHKPIQQPDAFRIRKEGTDEEKERQNTLVTTSDASDVAIHVVINSDKPVGEVVKEGKGAMSGEEQKLESTSIDSVEDAATATKSYVTTLPHSVLTSETKGIPRFSSISTFGSNTNRHQIFTKKINDVMGNICIVFPAAFKLLGGSARDTCITSASTTGGEPTPPPQESQPLHLAFITLLPSYLSSVSGEDLLFILDAIMSKGSIATGHASFDPKDDGTATSWMNRVRALASAYTSSSWSQSSAVSCLPTTTSPSTALSIPLYMLVLVSFHLSLLNSFRDHARISLRRDDLSALSSVIAVTAKGEAVTYFFELDDGRDASSSRLQTLLSLLKDLQRGSDSPAMEKVLSILESRFPERVPNAGIDDTGDVKLGLEDYLIQPFSVFLRKFSLDATWNHEVVRDLLQSINKGLNEALSTDELSLALIDVTSCTPSAQASIQTEAIDEENRQFGNEIVPEMKIETSNAAEGEGKTTHFKTRMEAQSSKKSKKKKKKKVRSCLALSFTTVFFAFHHADLSRCLDMTEEEEQRLHFYCGRFHRQDSRNNHQRRQYNHTCRYSC